MNAMSDEQVVMHVLRNRGNYYKIFMIERTATTEQVKVAYKKMALKCHPDKNKHAQAAEAFKIVGSANTTLSDETKRRIYDRAGAEGVQRHESGGGGGAGPRYRNPRAGGGQRDFFEEFFFGGTSGGTFFYPQQQQHRARAGQYQQQPGVHHAEFEINPNLLMLIPLVIFVILAFLLQSTMTDMNGFSSGGSGSGQRGGSGTSFSLTPSPDEGFIHKRFTSLYGLRVPYYTTRQWYEVMERRRDVLMATEQEVLKSQRDYLGNRCEAETFKHRTRGRKDAPAVCSEFHRFRRTLG